MSGAVVSSALKKFTDLLIAEGKFLYGVSDQVTSLQKELVRLQCFLKDADARQNESQSLRNWVAEIRDLVYDAEDIIETYVLKVESKGQGSGGIKDITKRFVGIFSETKTRHGVGSDIEVITTKLSQLATSLQAYGIIVLRDKESLNSSYVVKREQRQSFSHIVEHNVVGLDDSVEELVGVLSNGTSRSRVVSICGMGGLGKTTLAKKIYHNTQIKERFKLLAWTYISQQCQRRDVWAAILSQFTNGNSSISKRLRDEELAEKLYKLLQDNKCLVVLDDIWSIQTWDILKAAFPDETSSKILLTSRNKEVAAHADPQGFLYEPPCLKEKESWELFKKITFIQRDGAADERLEELGKQMVKRCAGLPLAITVLGGLLRQKIYLNYWVMIQDNLKSYLTKGNTIGENYSPVFDVFSLSYDNLSAELKQCFLYLGHFPEDYEIPVEKLIRFWIAEGMITSISHDREDVEIVAEGCLCELIERSMVLVGRRDTQNSKVITCRLHDTMRDLCLLKGQEEKFLEVISPQPQDENGVAAASSLTGNFHRLAVHLYHLSKEDRFFHQKHIRSPRLRSLLYFNRVVNYTHRDNESFKLLDSSFNKLTLLRVLDLEGAEIEGKKLSKDIGKLIHLRFLSLRDSNVVEFPSSLENLKLLETLDMRVYDAHVPNVLWKMEKLRHLYLPCCCDNKTELNLSTLRHLQTLENFQLGICNINDLFSMSNLKCLTVYGSSKSSGFVEIMPVSLSSSLKKLEFLSLGGSPEYGVIGKGQLTPIDICLLVAGFVSLSELVLYLKIVKLPETHQFPAEITSIILGTCEIKEDPMPVLEKLPNLRRLVLRWDGYIGEEMVCSAAGFPRLEYLDLFVLNNLKYWRIDEGAMPSLCKLSICSCGNLKKFPDGLRSITTLKKLNISGMPKSFKATLVKRRNDIHKVQHGTSIEIELSDDEQ